MNSLWNNTAHAALSSDSLDLRVYTSRLLGQEPSLVLHGGGNTSLKTYRKNLFGESEHILYVKGSGWDLATIEAAGFAPVKMDLLLRLAQLKHLSDTDMVREQKAAMTDPSSPAPSVEAILHAIIPFKYVDHTHADAVVAITNTPNGEQAIREVYGDRVLYIPYVMPGFILARKVFEMTNDIDWKKYEGLILMNHGIFSFADGARESYERMIRLVTEAEDYLKEKKAMQICINTEKPRTDKVDIKWLAKLRSEASKHIGSPVIANWNSAPEALGFVSLPNIKSIASRGPLTPDHVIHTKRIPMFATSVENTEKDFDTYASDYKEYFKRNTNGKLTCLDTLPRWVIWPEHGVLAFGQTAKKAGVVADIARHTMRVLQWSENLGGWKALPEKDIFEVEYWELEQAKLKKVAVSASGEFQGKVALVTGAASGIGKAVAQMLRTQGAAIVALDINPSTSEIFSGDDALGIVCDVTDPSAIEAALATAVKRFGGLDIVFTNAGSFPPGKKISDLDDESWKKSIELNLSSHHYLIRACVPFLELGIDPAIVVMASKNVPAPGPGAAAYSVAKAGLTQLARVAALELAANKIRVNILHPHAVFDTGIWTPEVLAARAKHYEMSVEDYKTNNLLKTEVTSLDVARLVCAMAGKTFSKTTGAQVAIDGGSDRTL